jgi:hypothetical protein
MDESLTLDSFRSKIEYFQRKGDYLDGGFGSFITHQEMELRVLALDFCIAWSQWPSSLSNDATDLGNVSSG